MENLPDPDILAPEISENLTNDLGNLRDIYGDLERY